MIVKKTPGTAYRSYSNVIPISGYPQQQLEGLYARRSALTAVIRSLEAYQRFRAKRVEPRQQTA